MDNRPIGVFDSGLGGLTAVKALKRFLPHENIIYFGDTARVPYGSRGVEAIKKFSLSDLKFIGSMGVKAVLAACGTVSSVAMPELKAESPVYITGVVEATAQKALNTTKNGVIGIIGTSATIRSGSYVQYITARNPSVKTVSKACPLFVPLVENGYFSSDNPVVRHVISDCLTEVKDKGIDTLILGCTHYPILEEAIADFFGNGVCLINSGTEAAADISVYLEENNLLSDRKQNGIIEYYVSDNVEGFAENAGIFLSEEIIGSVKKAEIEV